ncbi:unnamed protein product [Protopolystoma xenopodis]|uniref:Uncharacterized protein n=1 Tax=Protopolystoma xenopodis TaxID=117903 RepID=A0A448WVJ3_9PLAT|nr:unnamed protein product [Protopolystoma xenopodis]
MPSPDVCRTWLFRTSTKAVDACQSGKEVPWKMLQQKHPKASFLIGF